MLVAVLNKINFTEDSKMKIQETVNEQDILKIEELEEKTAPGTLLGGPKPNSVCWEGD